jgi:nitrilase
MIVDPWGVVLDRLSRGSGVITGFLNREYIKSVRKSLPALKHRILK